MFALSPDFLDVALRLLAAAGAGLLIGLNREIRGKPTGMRTLALVALSVALVATSAVHFGDLRERPDALSRVLQGTIQGVLVGVGFIGAGVIVRLPSERLAHGLTTAATVWLTAALGLACALAAWEVMGLGLLLALLILIAFKPVERVLLRWLEPPRPPPG